jgi:hypothetical protein
MAMQPYNLGLQLGQASLPGQAAGAQIYNQGFQNAANTQYQGVQAANALNSQFLSSLIGAASGGLSGGAGGGGGMFGGGTQSFGQFTRNLGSFQGGGVGANSWERML